MKELIDIELYPLGVSKETVAKRSLSTPVITQRLPDSASIEFTTTSRRIYTLAISVEIVGDLPNTESAWELLYWKLYGNLMHNILDIKHDILTGKTEPCVLADKLKQLATLISNGPRVHLASERNIRRL